MSDGLRIGERGPLATSVPTSVGWKTFNNNDVPGSVCCLFLLHFGFSKISEYQIICTTTMAVKIRFLNSLLVKRPPLLTLNNHFF